MDKMTFRFDDVCINADMELINKMTDFLIEKFDCDVMWGVSPLVHNDCGQRVYPKIFNAYSEMGHFFHPERCGIPELRPDIIPAGHGILHCDHRLLSRELQEFSIIASCSLIKSEYFIPPFNKWNKDTEEICRNQGIRLIKFELGWLSMEHNKWNQEHRAWYLHAREWTLESFKTWFK